MSEPILKTHGAHAIGVISEEPDGRHRASLTVRTDDLEREQQRGPEFFGTDAAASEWLLRQASHHGFAPDEFDIVMEPHNA